MKAVELPRIERSHLPTFPRLTCDYLADQGFCDTEIFSGLSFSRSDLSSEDFRLSPSEHEQFIKQVISLTDNPHLALAMIDRMIDVRSSAVLLLLSSSGRISKSLRLIAHYNQIYTRTLTTHLEEQNASPVFAIETHLKDNIVSYFALTSFILFLDNFFRDALAGRHLVMRAELSIPTPDGFEDVRERYAFDMQFDCVRTRIYLDPDLIDEPLHPVDPHTTRLIAEACERQLTELNAEISAAGAVKALIIENIAAPPTLDQTAAAFAVSSRSLRRILQQEGTSFGAVLSNARKDLAIKLLLDTNEAVSSIGYQIGFEYPSHFGRAFKRWTGQSPTQFRDAHKNR